jgi:hypothetical protein
MKKRIRKTIYIRKIESEREREKKDSNAINRQIASEKKKFGQSSRSLIARERI